MTNISDKLIEQSKDHLDELGYATYAKPIVNKSIGFYGYFFKHLPDELNELWLGTVKNEHMKGIVLGAKPSSSHGDEAIKKVMIEGFKWMSLIKPGKSGWFFKRIISPANIAKLAKMNKRHREYCLKMLLENTYPFEPE
jgi:hypothetical protein